MSCVRSKTRRRRKARRRERGSGDTCRQRGSTSCFWKPSGAGQPLGELLRREGLYSSDLARIRDHVKEGAPGSVFGPGRAPKPKTVSVEEYNALKEELEAKERAMADLSVELAILRKKTTGGTWDR